MIQDTNDLSNILKSARENINYILKMIELKLDEVRKKLENCESVLSSFMKQAIVKDFFYEPDLTIYNEIANWQELLLMSQKLLSNMDYTEDELMGDKGTYIEKSEELIELIDNNLQSKFNEFIELNTSLLIEGQTRKFESELKLRTLEKEIKGLRLIKENNMGKKEELQLQVDNLKFKFWKRKQRKEYMAQTRAYEEGDNHTIELINNLEQETELTKMELTQRRYNHGNSDMQGRRTKATMETNILQNNKKIDYGGIEPGNL